MTTLHLYINNSKRAKQLFLDLLIAFSECISFQDAVHEVLQNARKHSKKIESIPAKMQMAIIKEIHSYWDVERPSEYVFAALLLCFLTFLNPSELLLILLIRACNYYGCHDFVINYVYKQYLKQSGPKDFNVLKGIAKSFKCKGNFYQARALYIELFECPSVKKNKFRQAILLTLYAKLCNDFQQRLGWHLGFHSIAYKRVNRPISKTGRTSYHKKWERIIWESYAKAVGKKDYKEGVKLYQKIFHKYDKKDDGYIRAQAHYLDMEIEHTLKVKSIKTPTRIPRLMDSYQQLITITLSLENIRAYAIRSTNFIRHIRKIGEYWPEFITKSSNPLILERTKVMQQLKLNIDIAARLSDWKMELQILTELMYWEKMRIIDSGPINYDAFESEIIKPICDRMEVLEKKRVERVSSIYFEIVSLIASTYVELKNWDKAVYYFKLLFEYCSDLAKGVNLDAQFVASAINAKKKRIDKIHSPELKNLKIPELYEIQNQLSEDYKYLLDRMLSIYQDILSTQKMQLNELKVLQINKPMQYHNILERINELQYLSGKNLSLSNNLNEFECTIRKWSEEEREFYRKIHINLNKHIERHISQYKNERIKVTYTPIDEEFANIFFSEQALNIVLESFYHNARQSGEIIKLHKIYLEIYPFIDADLLYLVFRDNTARFEKIRTALRQLSEDRPVDSDHSLKKYGKGLTSVKRIIHYLSNIEDEWKLKQIDESIKEIIIPLFRIKKNG